MLETIHGNSHDENNDSELPKRNKRAKIEKNFGLNFLTYVLEGEPQTFKETVNSLESLMCKEAIQNEIDSILQSHT